VRTGSDAAWAEFLELFAPLLLQAASFVERDRDAAADAFVFVCERLRDRDASRLAQYDPARPGSFETWLRAVALNLSRDAKRRRVGRFRPLALVQRLPPLEQRVLRLRHEAGLTFEQTLASLRPEFPGLSEARLAEADAFVAARLTSQHRFLLFTRRPRFQALEPDPPESATDLVSTPDANPEWLALARESRGRLASAIAELPEQDRLLVRLHYERGVTLAALAPMLGMTNAQAVHRRLQAVLARLRGSIGGRV
jgi:RNA polymerase sigma factor (sigma-70 family)